MGRTSVIGSLGVCMVIVFSKGLEVKLLVDSYTGDMVSKILELVFPTF